MCMFLQSDINDYVNVLTCTLPVVLEINLLHKATAALMNKCIFMVVSHAQFVMLELITKLPQLKYGQ